MRSITLMLSFACFLMGLKAASDYDYYVFAIEWAGTVCRYESCSESSGIDPNFFNIHGLWPSQDGNSDEPSDCDGPSFSDTYLTENTLSDLKKFWSGLYSSADDFHNHEWTKHGTCWNDDVASRINVIEDFFQNVLRIAQTYNPYTVLSQAGIVPGPTYPLQKIKATLSKAYGIDNSFNIQCTAGHLSGLEICLSKSYKPINCPPQMRTTKCGSLVGYPPISPSLLAKI